MTQIGMWNRISPDQKTIEEIVTPVDTDGPWVVILYNCNCHTFDDVIGQLQLAISCSLEQAESIAFEAHTRGRAIAFTGEAPEAERVAGVLRAIRLQVETDRF